MTASTRDLLEVNKRLPEDERLSLAAEILRRTASLDLPPLGDVDLATAPRNSFCCSTSERRPMPIPSRGEVWMVGLGYVA